jgi:hypothetical protein
MGSGADYYRDRHVVVTGGTGALGTAMVGALLEAGAARARRYLKFCEIAAIKADDSAQDWASLSQQRIGQQTSTSQGGGARPVIGHGPGRRSSEAIAPMISAPPSAARRRAAISPSSLAAISLVVLAVTLSSSLTK